NDAPSSATRQRLPPQVTPAPRQARDLRLGALPRRHQSNRNPTTSPATIGRASGARLPGSELITAASSVFAVDTRSLPLVGCLLLRCRRAAGLIERKTIATIATNRPGGLR